MMDEIPVGISETRAMLRSGRSSVVEHVQSVLTAIHKVDSELGAFVSVASDTALRDAELADQCIRALGLEAWRDWPLRGVAVSVKDLIQTRDLPTRRGSLLPNPRPRVDAPAVARLRAAGAIVVGKTTTSEYGWCGSTKSRLGPATRNPWNPERSAGGSSGGAAAAVSAGLCAAALGTDGAGSIRIPASFCGVVGFKPSFGTVPYVPACADRLAHAGPITRSVRDVIELMPILAGPHACDPDSALRVIDLAGPCEPSSLRIGWLVFPGTSAEVHQAGAAVRDALRAQGHRVESMDVPFPDPHPALVDLIAASEAADTTPEQEELCDPGRLAVVRYGRTVSGAAVLRAEAVRLALRTTMRSIMASYDLLAMATVPIEPFDVDAIGPPWAAEPEDLAWTAWTPATYPFNLTGQPAISLPAGLSSAGLPIGVQLVGPFGGDKLVLSTALQVEAQLEPLPAVPDRVLEG